MTLTRHDSHWPSGVAATPCRDRCRGINPGAGAAPSARSTAGACPTARRHDGCSHCRPPCCMGQLLSATGRTAEGPRRPSQSSAGLRHRATGRNGKRSSIGRCAPSDEKSRSPELQRREQVERRWLPAAAGSHRREPSKVQGRMVGQGRNLLPRQSMGFGIAGRHGDGAGKAGEGCHPDRNGDLRTPDGGNDAGHEGWRAYRDEGMRSRSS